MYEALSVAQVKLSKLLSTTQPNKLTDVSCPDFAESLRNLNTVLFNALSDPAPSLTPSWEPWPRNVTTWEEATALLEKIEEMLFDNDQNAANIIADIRNAIYEGDLRAAFPATTLKGLRDKYRGRKLMVCAIPNASVTMIDDECYDYYAEAGYLGRYGYYAVKGGTVRFPLMWGLPQEIDISPNYVGDPTITHDEIDDALHGIKAPFVSIVDIRVTTDGTLADIRLPEENYAAAEFDENGVVRSYRKVPVNPYVYRVLDCLLDDPAVTPGLYTDTCQDAEKTYGRREKVEIARDNEAWAAAFAEQKETNCTNCEFHCNCSGVPSIRNMRYFLQSHELLEPEAMMKQFCVSDSSVAHPNADGMWKY